MSPIVHYEGHFSCAHALWDYEGKCARLHGHNWEVTIEVATDNLNSCGMVVDFNMLKKLLEKFDHKMLYNDDFAEHKDGWVHLTGPSFSLKVKEEYAVGFRGNPTAEIIARNILTILIATIPNVSSAVVFVRESGHSEARTEWIRPPEVCHADADAIV
ncbi:MAG: 6-pyruvoyl trahydropterin synthase family protein [Candidatus Thorarchaeota archaeon]